jgi:hypothetical protein
MTDVRNRAPLTEDQTVRLEVPARPGYIVLARLALSAVTRLTALEDEDVADLKLAITEAATAYVGDADEGTAGILRPVPDPDDDDESTLRFSFELRDDSLVVEVECDCDIDISEEELELSRAIINATVDDCQSRPGSITLVKRLAPAAG